jgi:hypothetical protein
MKGVAGELQIHSQPAVSNVDQRVFSFIEDQAFLPLYDLASPPPLPPRPLYRQKERQLADGRGGRG